MVKLQDGSVLYIVWLLGSWNEAKGEIYVKIFHPLLNFDFVLYVLMQIRFTRVRLNWMQCCVFFFYVIETETFLQEEKLLLNWRTK